MKILILSRDKNYYSTKRLVEESRKKHHSVLVIDPLQCNISITNKGFSISTNEQDLSDFDIVIPRLGIIGIDYALLVIQQFELMGKPSLNSANALGYTKNKFQSLQVLCKSGIPIPATMMTRNPETVKDAIKRLGGLPAEAPAQAGLPVILKLFRGSQGKGVILGENIASVESILTAVWAIGYDIILQEYLAETRGEDIRILVLGDEVIAAMKRTPAKNDFRSNIHQGGRIKKVTISSEEKQLALQSTKALGLKLSGVDIMRTHKGPVVLEVNASPGFEGLEKVTRINIAGKIIHFASYLSTYHN